ncbi:MAG: hypothetical protein R3C17_08625 [Planctomycetaceae bacterium]
MLADEGRAGRLTCLLAGHLFPQLRDCQPLVHCLLLAHCAMDRPAFQNLPLLTAFRRGFERIAGVVLVKLFSAIGQHLQNSIEILEESDKL